MSSHPLPSRTGRMAPSASTLLALDALLARAVSSSSSSSSSTSTSTSTSSSVRPLASRRSQQPLPPSRQDTLAAPPPPPRLHDKTSHSRQHHYLAAAAADSADTEEYDHGDESTDDLEDIDLGALASTKDLSAFLQGHIQRQQLLQQQQQQQHQLLQRQRLQRQQQREQYQRLYKEQQLKLQQQRLQAEQESAEEDDDPESEDTACTPLSHRDQRVLQREQQQRDSEQQKNNKLQQQQQRNTATDGRVHARVMSNPFKVVTEQDDSTVASRSRKPAKSSSTTTSDSTTTATSEPAQTCVSAAVAELPAQTAQTSVPAAQVQQAQAPASTPAEEPSSTSSSATKEETKTTPLETAVQAPSAPPKRQYKKTILRAQAALLAAQIKGENETRDLEATRRVLARVDAIKHLRALQSRLTYAAYKVKNGLEDQPLDLVSELFEESLDESTTSGDECRRPSSRGAALKATSLPSPPAGTVSRKGKTAVPTKGSSSSVQLATEATRDPKERSKITDHGDTTSGPDSESESVTQELSSWSTAQELPSDLDLPTIALRQKELALEQQKQLEELQRKQREQLQELKKLQQEQQLALQKAHAQVAAARRPSTTTTTTTTNTSRVSKTTTPVANKTKGHLREHKNASNADKENQPPQPSVDHRVEKENRSSNPRTPSRSLQQNRSPLSAKKVTSSAEADRKHSTDRASRSSTSSASQVDITADVASKALSPQRSDSSKQAELRLKPQQPKSPQQQEEYLQRQQQKLQQNRQREQELLQRQRQLEHQQLQQHKRKQLLLQLHQQQLLEQAWETRTAREAPPPTTTTAKQRPLSVPSSQTGSQASNKASTKGSVSNVGSAVAISKKKKPLNPVHKAPNTENILATMRDSSYNIRSGIVAATPALTTAKNNVLGTKRMHSVFEDKENWTSPPSSPLLRERTMASFDHSPSSRSKVHKRQKPATPSSCSGDSPTLQSLPQIPLTTLSMQQQLLQLTQQQQQQPMDPLPIMITTDMTPTSSPLPAMHSSGGGTSADFAAALVAISPALTPMLSSDHLSSETTEFNGEFLNCFDQWMSDLGSEDVNSLPIGQDGFQPTFDFASLMSVQEEDGQAQTLAAQSCSTEDETRHGGQGEEAEEEEEDDEEEDDDETELDESELDQLLYSDVGDDYYGSYGSGQEYTGTPSSEIVGAQELASDPVVADLYGWFPEPIQHPASLSPFVSFLSTDPTLSSSPAELPTDLTQELDLTLDFTAAGGDPLWLQQELRLQQEQQLQLQLQLQQQQPQEHQQQQQQLLDHPEQLVQSLPPPFESSEAEAEETEETEEDARARTPLLDSTTSTLLSSNFSDLLSSPSALLSHGNPYITTTTTDHGFAAQDADPAHKQAMASILTV